MHNNTHSYVQAHQNNTSNYVTLQPTPHHNCFTVIFPGPPGCAGARRELQDFMVILLGATGLISAHLHHAPICVSASVNLPLHHKDQKFSSGTGSPWWSWKKGRKMIVVV